MRFQQVRRPLLTWGHSISSLPAPPPFEGAFTKLPCWARTCQGPCLGANT